MSQMPLSPIIKQSYSKGKKSNLLDHLEKSFVDNSQQWQESYPGLTLPYLKNHFYDLWGNRFPKDLFFNQWFGGLIELKWKRYHSLLNLGRPLAYIAKSGHFFETDFYVDERVLIPRFETEVLLECVLNELKDLDSDSLKENDVRLAEVGVGPGTLSLSIAQQKYHRPLDIIAGDISKEALEVCELNLFRLGFAIPKVNNIKLILSDRLNAFEGEFDLIISNPPYIKRKSDFKEVHAQVIKNEPEMALFLDDDSYKEWFDSFFIEVGNHLKLGGLFLMEGHENHLQNLYTQIKSIFSCEGEVIKDLTGRDRVLKIRKTNG